MTKRQAYRIALATNASWVVYQKIKHLGNYDSTTIDFDAPKEEYIWLVPLLPSYPS